MFDVTRDLHQGKKYSFQTDPSGRTMLMRVGEFLDSTCANEALVSVDSAVGPNATRLWSVYEGWDTKAYQGLLEDHIRLFDQGCQVSQEFVGSVLGEGLSVFDAVQRWFEQTDAKVSVVSHAQGHTGILDVDVHTESYECRAVVPMDVQPGDSFNVYCGESEKYGVHWRGDLLSSLSEHFLQDAPANGPVASV